MADYKDSLNLPETAFSMKANLVQREPQCLSQWQENKVYEQIRKARNGAPRFVLHDGPPYANGHLHCGHALNKILKDIIIKSKTLSGFDAAFVPGWDCHGLPIELNVEKKVGKAGIKISEQAFREKCRAYALSQIDIQRNEFKRLGVFGDWQAPYISCDHSYEANTLRALAKIIANGHLEQGFMPVHWCIDCHSSLAEAEIEYQEKVSPSLDIAFYALNPLEFIQKIAPDLAEKPLIVPIWTTTPWSLAANEAVCLHPESDYELVDTGEYYFLLASLLVEPMMQRYDIANYQRCGKKLGKTFVHLSLRHPFYPRLSPIVLGEHVSLDSGTGCVHTAPAHGQEDYQIGKAFNLPLINPILSNGCYAKDLPYLGGLSVLKVYDKIIELLKTNKTLLQEESISHSYPHCWRHKSPTLFLATPQWFIAMDKNGLRQALLKEINNVSWVPDWGLARIGDMISSRPNWCISRQRHWGTPLPLLIHKESKALHPQTLMLIEEVALGIEKEKKDGIDIWLNMDIEKLLGADAHAYEKVTDTLDVWFDSGISHYAVLLQHPDLQLPADVYLEGSDQHRGWFNSSLTTAVAIYGHAPYKTVLTHGYTVDANGKKLSKSQGNYVSLEKLIQLYGADILRLWVCSTDYRHEVSICDEILKRNAEAYRRIRNTARFFLANLADFNPNTDLLAPEQLLELDAYALSSAQALQKEILNAYENYHFHLIYQKIHNFCAVDMGSFYLDIIKDRLYTSAKNSVARRSAQSVMYHIIQAFTLWLAPVLSFTAEEIWSFIPQIPEKSSIFTQSWYKAWPEINTINKAFWQEIQTLRNEVNKALETSRQEGLIGSSLAAIVILYAQPALYARLKRIEKELHFIFISSKAKLEPMSEKPNILSTFSLKNLGLDIAIEASIDEKCARCWHRSETVGKMLDAPDLCQRCIGNLNADEERRSFA